MKLTKVLLLTLATLELTSAESMPLIDRSMGFYGDWSSNEV